MNKIQAEILNQFIRQVAELACHTLTAYVQSESESEKDLIATSTIEIIQSERKLLTKTELAGRLGVCVRTIGNLQNEGMPVRRLMKRVQFDYEEVLQWTKDREIKSRRKKNLRMVG